METEVLHIAADNAIAAALREAHRTSKLLPVVLETGEAFVLLPDRDFEALHSLFNNPDFVFSLERAVEDFKATRGKVRKRGERPTPG